MKNKIILLAMVAAVLGTSSCKKDLDQQPTDSFSENNAFVTLDDIQLGANAVYGRYGAYANDMYVSALLSDEAKLGADNSGQGALTYRYQYNSDNTSGGDVIGAWGSYYSVIDQCNRLLPKIPTVTAAADQEPRRNVLKGQMLAMRAIAHFGLLQSFCKNYNPADSRGVPVMLVSDPLAKPSRKSMGEVMAQIESDLSAAKALLPTVTFSDFRDTVMNKVNVAAYQARVALYKKDYDNAVTYATEVISSGIKPLATGAQFAAIWTDDVDDEVLFRVRYATSTAIGGLWTTTGGNVYIAPSDKLFGSFLDATFTGRISNDTLFVTNVNNGSLQVGQSIIGGTILPSISNPTLITRIDTVPGRYILNRRQTLPLTSLSAFRDNRLPAYIGINASGNKYVNKFYSSSRGGRVVDMKACRTSEMYLIRAEANAKKASPDLAAASADLNFLRSKRINVYVNQTFPTASSVIDATLQERYKELAFEGFRFWDLKRNNLSVERLSSDASAEWQTLLSGNYRFVLPIPNSELLANPNMVQNDNY
jgi:hypothetical protein